MNRLRHMIAGLLLFGAAAALPAVSVPAAKPVEILFNGETLATDVAPVIVHDRTLVPMRIIFEALGYSIEWNSSTKVVTGHKEGTSLSLKIGQNLLTANGKKISLDVAAQIMNDRTMVPLRAVAEATGAEVLWDSTSRTVKIYTEEQNKPYNVFDSIVTVTTNVSQGSGFIYSADGLIATNCHVIDNAKLISVNFNDGSFVMDGITVAGYDASRDIALLRIPKTGLHPVTISDSFAKGDPVITIGAAEGKKNTTTTGHITDITDLYIVSDAVITHGNSGGVLLNSAGEVIGVPTFSADSGHSVYYVSQKAAALHNLEKNRTLSLEAFNEEYTTLLPPSNFSATAEEGQFYLDWEFMNHVDHYLLYECDTRDGDYTPITNPQLRSKIWHWNYPHCFGMTFSGHGRFQRYYKVASVKDGKVSELSMPVFIDFTY